MIRWAMISMMTLGAFWAGIWWSEDTIPVMHSIQMSPGWTIQLPPISRMLDVGWGLIGPIMILFLVFNQDTKKDPNRPLGVASLIALMAIIGFISSLTEVGLLASVVFAAVASGLMGFGCAITCNLGFAVLCGFSIGAGLGIGAGLAVGILPGLCIIFGAGTAMAAISTFVWGLAHLRKPAIWKWIGAWLLAKDAISAPPPDELTDAQAAASLRMGLEADPTPSPPPQGEPETA